MRKNIFGSENVSNEKKVMTALAYAHKRAQLGGQQDFSGIEQSEIGSLLRRMGSPMSGEDISSVLEKGVGLYVVDLNVKRVGRKMKIEKYDISQSLEQTYENYLMEIGLLKVNLKKI